MRSLPDRPRHRRPVRALLRRGGAALCALALGSSLAVMAAPGAVAGDQAPGAAELPTSFGWSSSGVLVSPKPDAAHPIVSIKDPSVVRYRDRWLVYATTANTSGNWSLAYLSFSDWSQAAAAPQYFLDQNPGIGTGYRAAPQVFYFAPQKKWYLVYQTGLPSYSTTTDPTRPETWSATKNFQETMPQIIADNIGDGFWLDMWVICDKVNCYLFSSDDNGHLYRAQTRVRDFPNGFGKTVIVVSDPNRFRLFEAANVYRIKGSNTYLLLVEAIGTDGRRYFRSWTAEGIDGDWVPLADTEANPFARANNVAFPDGAWSQDISHGEMIRAGIDQTLTIDPCNLRYLYQGMDPAAGGEYSQLPWRLGLLTQTNSAC
ncbi:MAG TPA: non-reducing end alpha-L-arabinofuranosidase family hydrolase [Streptosporangiaceae bacterium]|nr:non-reducing end alpha-L-arabinofuranosidase family hydrolase [Streptosporangiaceae bacterium]